MGGDKNGGAFPLTGIDFVYQEDRWRQGIEERAAKQGLGGPAKPGLEKNSFEAAAHVPDDAEKSSLRIRAELDRRFMNKIVPGTRRYAACVRLWAAAYFGLIDEIIAALHDGAVVDYPDCRSFEFMGFTALHWAAFKNDVEAIEVLVQCGAYVDMRSTADDTPIHVAASQGHTAAVKTLVRLEAKLDIPDSKMLSPLERAYVLRHYETAEVIAEAEQERAELELDEKLLALGKRMSKQWSRAKAGLPRDENEAKAIDQTGRFLAKELVAVKKWRSELEEGSGGKGRKKREETVEEFEEQRVRTEAEQLLERGLANTFQEAVTLVMYNRQAMERLREAHSELSTIGKAVGEEEDEEEEEEEEEEDMLPDPHEELSQTQLPTEEELKAVSKAEAAERMGEYREHLAMMCEQFPAVKAVDRLTVNPYDETAKRVLYEERYKGNVPEGFEEMCQELFGSIKNPDEEYEDEDEERDPYAPPSEESDRASEQPDRADTRKQEPTAAGEDGPPFKEPPVD